MELVNVTEPTGSLNSFPCHPARSEGKAERSGGTLCSGAAIVEALTLPTSSLPARHGVLPQN